MRKRWLFVPLVIGLLALGLTGGVVAAQGGGSNGDTPLKSFAARVATILGLDEAQVQDAFHQAARELQDEAFQRRLDHMVEQGRLTQEQADEYLEWLQSRPDVGIPDLQPPGFGGGRFMGRGMMGRRGFHDKGSFPGFAPGPGPAPGPAPEPAL